MLSVWSLMGFVVGDSNYNCWFKKRSLYSNRLRFVDRSSVFRARFHEVCLIIKRITQLSIIEQSVSQPAKSLLWWNSSRYRKGPRTSEFTLHRVHQRLEGFADDLRRVFARFRRRDDVQNDLREFFLIWNGNQIEFIFCCSPHNVAEYFVISQKKAIPQLKLEKFRRNFALKIIAEEMKIKFQNIFSFFAIVRLTTTTTFSRGIQTTITQKGSLPFRRELNCSKLPE